MEFSEIKGLVFKEIKGLEEGSDQVDFVSTCGRKLHLYHPQDCCEDVRIVDVVGDVSNLLNTPILLAEEVSDADGDIPIRSESYTWTFYKLATIKGYVDIRWLGESNGCYSERVEFDEF
jgi:hypothetical protein